MPTAKINKDLRARNLVEGTAKVFLIGCSTVAILTTLGIVLSVLFESLRFFQSVPFFDFLFGLQWSPQTAMRADQAGSSGAFGAVPVFVGTLLIAVIAMLVAIPVGLLAAIYLSEYASHPDAHLGQADAGDSGRDSNRGLRFFCRPDGGAPDPRYRPGRWGCRSPRKVPWPPAWSWGL